MTTAIMTAPTPTTTASQSSAILNALGTGSGIDTVTLAANLTAANRAPLDAALKARSDANSAEISALGLLQSGVASFTSTIDSIVSNGDVGLQPASADPATISIARDPAITTAQPLASSIEVQSLATAQTLVSSDYTAVTAPVGFGTLTLSFGTLSTDASGAPTALAANAALASKTITITAANDTLGGVRDAINASKSGVTASIVNDGHGFRLVLRGATGVTSAFTLSATPAPGSPAGNTALNALAYAPGATGLASVASATNAHAMLDGIAIERSTNSFSDVLPGYTLTLNRANVGRSVALSAARDPALLADAVNSFIAAYNQFNIMLGADIQAGDGTNTSGPLYGESAIQSLHAQFAGLTSTRYANGAGTISLADLGVKTAQDGSLSIDATKLQSEIAADPAAIQALFATTTFGATAPASLSGALDAFKLALTTGQGGFVTLSARLTQQTASLATEKAKIDSDSTSYSATLTRQFSAMNSAVAAYKSIGSFLTDQIAQWNNVNNIR